MDEPHEQVTHPALKGGQRLTIMRGDLCGWLVSFNEFAEFQGMAGKTAAFTNGEDLSRWLNQVLIRSKGEGW